MGVRDRATSSSTAAMRSRSSKRSMVLIPRACVGIELGLGGEGEGESESEGEGGGKGEGEG